MRFVFILSLLLLSFTLGFRASAADFYVTSVIRDVPMSKGEIVPKDYYINAGVNNGLQEGVVLDVRRKMITYDNINSRVIGNTAIKIAKIKVIHSDGNFSIARMVKWNERDKTPLAGYDGVMIGDLIEVASNQ